MTQSVPGVTSKNRWIAAQGQADRDDRPASFDGSKGIGWRAGSDRVSSPPKTETMKTNKSRGMKWILQAVGLCFAMTAWGQMDMTGANANMDMSGMKMDKSGSQFSQAMDASMKKMDHGMASATMTGDPDHDFAAMMIPHHQGAIDMAQVELKYGKNPELRALCQRIIVAQKKEIAQMKAWLADHPAK